MQSSSRESRAFELFDACVDLSPAARALRLEALRRSDPTLHADVLRLLVADALPEGALRSPQKILADCGLATRDEAAGDPRIGSTLGAWRIEGLIGSGGMGRVYRAQRADGQYTQEVALKCVDVEASTPALAEVIRNERDMLAMLDHPNIATLLDGGVDADGCPWFAMQRVHGAAIDLWCDHRRLDLRARVGLFIVLCDGLRYAHEKGALHSDLKPSNVLVDDSGRPVLLDFGLSSLAARSHAGAGRMIAMTPGYCAPEVPARGYSVASDLYALGVVLRGLLCGVAAETLDSMAPAEAEALPSALARRAPPDAAMARGLANAAALARALEGDLDSIVAACVAADPDRRTPSVAHLQADLRAWLEHRPVSTRPRTSAYRLRLFLRRHRIAVLASACVALAAGIGVAVGLRLYVAAADHAQDAQSMRRLFERSFDALTTGGLGQSPLMSMAMLRDAEASLRDIDAAGSESAGASSLMLMALARSQATLGDYRHAMALLDEAQARSAGRDEQQAPLQAARAHLLNLASRHPQAHAAAQAGFAGLDAVSADERESTRLMLDIELARALWGMARIEEGRAALKQALERATAMAARDPRPLAALLIQHGQWQRLFSRLEAAQADFERAIELARERAPLIADEATIELVQTLKQRSEHARAVELATALLERRRRLLGEEHPETGKAWWVLGYAHFWNGDADSALGMAQRSVAILSAALGEEHPETVRASLAIGVIQAHRGKAAEAVSNARRALAIMQSVYGPDHAETLNAMGHLIATLAVTAPAPPHADAIWREVAELSARRVEIGMRQGLPMLSERMVSIKARMRLGTADAATRKELEEIIAALEEALGPNSDSVHNARFTLVEAEVRLGDERSARAELASILSSLSSAPVTMVTEVARINCLEKLGDLAWKAGESEIARGHWEQAHAISQRIEPGQSGLRRLESKLARSAAR